MLAQFIQHVRSRLGRLFELNHLTDTCLVAHLQPVQIDSSGDGLALPVPAIPNQPVFARRQGAVPHLAHRLPQDVITGGRSIPE